jgi:hypothetical protein
MSMLSFIQSLSYTPPATVEPEPEPEARVFNLATSENSVTYTGAQSRMSAQSAGSTSRLFTPRMMYSNGKTYDLYTRTQIDYYGQLGLFVFDKLRGLDRPVNVGPIVPKHSTGVPDTHTIGCISFANDGGGEKIYATQEITHLVPFTTYKGVNGDRSKFTTAFQIGVNCAYANIIEGLGGHPAIWHRGGNIAGNTNHLYSLYITESTDGFEGLDTATPRRITERPGVGLWHYPGVPWGHHKVGSTYYLTCTLRTGSADNESAGGYVATRYSAYYLLLTDDFITFRNYIGTFSHNTSVSGLLTDAILQANFMFHQTDDVETQGRLPASGLSANGFFASIVGNVSFDGSYVFKYYSGGVVQSKPVSIAGLHDVGDQNQQAGAIDYMMIFSQNEIIIKANIDDGTYVRSHFFKTTNLGDSWNNLGDVFPDIANTTYGVRLPNNIMQISENENFMISAFSNDSSGNQFYHAKVAAWGNIQPIPGVTPTAATDFNPRSLGLWHYERNDANIVRSGNDVSQLTDKLGLRNAAGVNNPQWVSPDAVTTNGTNSSFTIANVAAIAACTAFTYIVVARRVVGSSNNFLLSLTDNTSSNAQIVFTIGFSTNTNKPNITFTIPATGVINGSNVIGQDDIADGNYHVFAFRGDGDRSYKINTDGKLQFFESGGLDSADPIEVWQQVGKAPVSITTVNAANIGRRDLTTDTFLPSDIKEDMFYSDVLTDEEVESITYALCVKYGITYQNQFSVPA